MLFLLGANLLDHGVDLCVHWDKKALIDSHSSNWRCLVHCIADPVYGEGSRGHAAEACRGDVDPWTRSALASQTHDVGSCRIEMVSPGRDCALLCISYHLSPCL